MAYPIKALRDWMDECGIDAYVQPHADRFQGEYQAPHDAALAWLTGFTGSAGLAVVTRQAAALFVDGRYTVQAPAQVDGNIFSVYETPHARPAQWLEKQIARGDSVALDPWLFTVASARQWDKTAADHGWHVNWVTQSPVDMLWENRPAPQKNKVFLHAQKYAGQSPADKVRMVIKKMAPDAARVLVTDPLLVCWLLNIRGRDVPHTPVLQSAALVGRDGHVTLFADTDKISATMQKKFARNVMVESLDRLAAVLGSSLVPVQLDPAQASKALFDACLRRQIPVVEAEDPCMALRAVKNAMEIAGAVRAHSMDARAFAAFRKWYAKQNFARTAVAELTIVDALHHFRAKNPDFVDESFDTIAGFAANGAIVHYRATDDTNKRLRPGNILLLDSGGQYPCGTTDVTRVLPVGKPTAVMKKHYTAVLKGLIALSSARFPVGTTGAQLDALARAPIWELGLDYSHGTGHGVGSFLSVHEGPQSVSPRGHAVLQPGMILSIEPGIYLNGQYGIRLENLVVVVDDTKKSDRKTMLAFKTLTKIPFEKSLIDMKALNAAEKRVLRSFGVV